MRAIVMRIGLVIFLCFVATSAAVLIGYLQPLSPRVSMLYLNSVCRLPCWLGITPDVTSLTEAQQKLTSYYSNYPNYGIEFDKEMDVYRITDKVSGNELFRVRFTGIGDDNTVGQIEIDFPVDSDMGWESVPTDPSLGELMGVVGQPTSVALWDTDTERYPGLLYENCHLGILLDPGDFDTVTQTEITSNIGMSVSIASLVLDNTVMTMTETVSDLIPRPWTGFHNYTYLEQRKSP